MALMGLALVGFHGDPKVRYLGVFFATAGANANVPVTASYQANNIRGQWKRAFCSATLVGFGALGGITVAMGSQLLIITLVCVLTLDFKRQNGKADHGEKRLEDGDKDFRYTY